MRRFLFFFIITSTYFSVAGGQDKLIGNEVILAGIEHGLDCMYNYEFEKADSLFRIIEDEIPNHPVVPFLEGLNIFWQNAPLSPNNSDAVNMFIQKMNKCAVLSDEVMKSRDDYIEGSFFSLVAHAMQMMYYADNDQIMKVIKHIPYSYRRVVKAFDLRDAFKEYKFFTGLYSYYIEAYPETHTAYKPLLIFLHKGSRIEGLKELNWIANNSVFMKAEGLFFLHHIYLSYECNPQMALNYAEQLHELYPDNTFYLVHLIFNLFVVNDYEKAAELIPILEQQKKSDDFAQMMELIFNGMIEELVNHNYEVSEKLYKKGIEMAVEFNPRVDTYIALAYAGLSRIYEREGMVKLAKENKKIAFAKTDYPCILE
jgi:tetratricopeptide (TPR) repeat protein